jgi:putative oxidoreductase
MWKLVLRLTVGGLFAGHGAQKLFGWFGGEGVSATGQMFEKLGLRPGRVHATAAGAAELGGGALLAAGAATPLAAASLTATMITAVDRVHLRKGLWVTEGGYEYNLVLAAALLTLVETGPGPLSLSRRHHSGPIWALWALAAAIAGAAGVRYASDAAGGEEPVHEEEPAEPEESYLRAA